MTVVYIPVVAVVPVDPIAVKSVPGQYTALKVLLPTNQLKENSSNEIFISPTTLIES